MTLSLLSSLWRVFAAAHSRVTVSPSRFFWVLPRSTENVRSFPYFFHLHLRSEILNPRPAELFQVYFSSFKAGNANAISSFK